MNNKLVKSGVLAAIIITLVSLVLLNVCTFVIPFNKVDSAVFFTAYGCSEFVILMEMVIVISQLFLEGNPNQRVLGLSIVHSGYVTTIAQIVLTAIFYIVNAFIALPLWVVLVIECLILGIGVIQIVKGFFFKTRVEEYHEKVANTKFMDEFRVRLKALDKINTIASVSKELSDLVDVALGSDPITNEKTIDSEVEVVSLFQELYVAIKDGSEERTSNTIKLMKNVLLERNTLCKAGK